MSPYTDQQAGFLFINAHYTEGSLEIIEIKNLGNNEHSMSYRYKWPISNACLDISSDDNIKGTVTFNVAEKGLLFDAIANSCPSTVEEL